MSISELLDELHAAGCMRQAAERRAESAEAERDRMRDALIACRPAVEFAQRQYVKASLQRPIADPLIDGKAASLSTLLDTIDAAAKGQG